MGAVAGELLGNNPLLAAGDGVSVAVAVGSVIDRVAAFRRPASVAPEPERQDALV